MIYIFCFVCVPAFLKTKTPFCSSWWHQFTEGKGLCEHKQQLPLAIELPLPVPRKLSPWGFMTWKIKMTQLSLLFPLHEPLFTKKFPEEKLQALWTKAN